MFSTEVQAGMLWQEVDIRSRERDTDRTKRRKLDDQHEEEGAATGPSSGRRLS